ncbi:MAG: ankyrin repeat domain-containing protein, partial [Thermodesulfobacteriota bacterium]|nr:ankyrin repeat domain-containing protein [Thermodesulfobacteriota bacterium]
MLLLAIILALFGLNLWNWLACNFAARRSMVSPWLYSPINCILWCCLTIAMLIGSLYCFWLAVGSIWKAIGWIVFMYLAGATICNLMFKFLKSLVGLSDWTPLHTSSITGDEGMTRLHISMGADVNAKGRVNFTPLHSASIAGHKEVAELLISKGANVNAKSLLGETPLHWAYCHKEVAELLISKGANVNAK